MVALLFYILAFADIKTFVYICDFHREQSWERWTKKTENGVGSNKDQLLYLLRKVANSGIYHGNDFPRDHNYKEALKELQDSELYKMNTKVQKWLNAKWLPQHRRWVKAFREDAFNIAVNTNNGLESQNKLLKYSYLSNVAEKSLTTIVTTLVEDFFPEQHKKYIRMNVRMSGDFQSYREDIPQYLQGRPSSLVKHCLKRITSAEDISATKITCIGNLKFSVKSESKDNVHYTVNVAVPSCQCMDWKITKFPCKHMFAIFNHVEGVSWLSLPEAYRGCAHLNPDRSSCHPDSESTSAHNKEVPPHVEHGENGSSECLLDLPEKKKQSIKTCAQKARARLSALMGLTYECKDTQVLEDITNKLSELENIVQSSIPKSSGDFLTLRSSPTKRRRTSKKNVSSKNNIGCLKGYEPPAKKRLHSSHRNRVGQKADMMRKMYKVNVPVPENNKAKEPLKPVTTKPSAEWRNCYRTLVTKRELLCLESGNWLNDMVIDAALQ